MTGILYFLLESTGMLPKQPAGVTTARRLLILIMSAIRLFGRGLSCGALFRPINTQARPLMDARSEEHTSELQSRENLVCRLLLEKKKKKTINLLPQKKKKKKTEKDKKKKKK